MMALDINYIVETKLIPPTIYQAINRKKLCADKIDELNQCKLALLKAPAGYGKSTLLAQWYQHHVSIGGQCIWLSLGPEDNEPSRFLRYLAHALNKIKPGIAVEIISYIDSGDNVTLMPILQLIVKLFSDVNTKYYIFFDDFHLITNQRLYGMVDWLCNFSNDSLHIIIGSRQELPFSVSRLKLQNKYREFGVDDLQFTPQECREIITNTSSVQLSDDQYSKIADKTEGWPAAVMLASMSLDGIDDLDSFVDQISGNDRDVADYLSATVMAQLPEKQRHFMESISPCDRFCADLCDAIAGAGNGRQLLKEISQQNLFLISLDRVGKWYRYHHLFSEFLIDSAFEGKENEKRIILIKTAQWHMDNGYIDEAIRYALKAKEFILSAQWISNHAEDVVQYRGEHSTLLSWVNNMPSEILDRWPMIRVYNAWSFAFTHSYSAAENELEIVESLLKGDKGNFDSIKDKAIRTIELIRCMMWGLRDRAKEALYSSDRWVHKWPQAKGFEKAMANVVLAYACKCSSEFSRSKQCLYTCFSLPENEKSSYIEAWAEVIMIVLLAKQGLHNEAITECINAKKNLELKIGCNTHMPNMLSVLLAAMMYEINEIDQAKELLDHSLIYVREQGTADSIVAGYQTKAKILFLDKNYAEGFKVLREGEKHGYIRDFPRVALSLLGEQIIWLLRLNRIDRARELIAQHKDILKPSVKLQEHWQFALSDLLKIKIMIADDENMDIVLELLSTSIRRAKNLNQGHKIVELLLIKSLALAKAGALRDSHKNLGEALVRAAPQGYIRVFVDEGDTLKSLLSDMVKSGVIHELGIKDDYLKKLLQEFNIIYQNNGNNNLTDDTHINLITDKLTKKEIAILNLLSDGKRNKDIAEILFVTEGTIKWHLHNIYAKLDVRGRTEAVSLARKLTVIS